jgi:ubiquinone/menaquinone biosynthesis C-methylase UbiE
MSYYDNIAKQWHEFTGYKGGVFKELVLNNALIEKIPEVNNYSILELGAGNGYFMPLLLKRFSGQVPSEIIITDKSERLLEIAKRHFRIPDAEYQNMDVCRSFPYASNSFDLIIASMVFNELPSNCCRNALRECYRILKRNSLLLISVLHPDFIGSLQKRELLRTTKNEVLTMPGSGNLRLPVVIRSLENYRSCLREAGFHYEETEVNSSKEVLNIKAGLRNAGNVPIALVYACTNKIDG